MRPRYIVGHQSARPLLRERIAEHVLQFVGAFIAGAIVAVFLYALMSLPTW